MATWQTVWKVLQALPGTEQGLLHDNPAVRVRGKLVAYLPSNPAAGRHTPPTTRSSWSPGATSLSERRCWPRTPRPSSSPLVTPHYQTYPGVIVRLATVRPDQLRELLTEAWRLVAPKRLVRELANNQAIGR